MSAATSVTTSERNAIRPFHFKASEEALTGLRGRISATQWPDRETVPDQSQGPQLATLQKLARYWVKDYGWRKVEARLNALPNFVTEIDGLDIHFLHVRSRHKNALPLIVTHGWPGSVIEQLKIVDPLTNPTAHAASAADAFDLVIPSMPGYGFSSKPTTTGWNPAQIARAWVVLMKRLGYTKFVAQGGDWGAIITDLMAAQGHPELLGIHSNMPGVFSPEVERLLLRGLRRRPVSLRTRDTPTSSWPWNTRRVSATASRWVCARRRFTALQILPSALRVTSSIMTRGVWRSFLGLLTDSPKV
jgi:pimeloyl-ACP methyl ester carboxylesterase